jgi:AraC-like DNA-binding protein
MEGAPLVLFSIAYFFAIAYSTISLYTYGVSKDMERVEEAEMSEEIRMKSEESAYAGEELGNCNPAITEAVERWKQSDCYREHNLTLGIVARQMGVPQKQLQEWLRQSEYGKLAGLVTTLRIEEAKRVLKEHPEWSTESVANYCGFSSREYFHRTFRQMTGSTPANYQASFCK